VVKWYWNMWGFQDAETEHASALRYTYISCPIWHCFILNWVRVTMRLVAAGMIQQGLFRTTSAQQCLPRHTRVTRETKYSSDLRYLFSLWISPCHRSLPSWDSVPDLVHVPMIYRPSRRSNTNAERIVPLRQKENLKEVRIFLVMQSVLPDSNYVSEWTV